MYVGRLWFAYTVKERGPTIQNHNNKISTRLNNDHKNGPTTTGLISIPIRGLNLGHLLHNKNKSEPSIMDAFIDAIADLHGLSRVTSSVFKCLQQKLGEKEVAPPPPPPHPQGKICLQNLSGHYVDFAAASLFPLKRHWRNMFLFRHFTPLHRRKTIVWKRLAKKNTQLKNTCNDAINTHTNL